jgi:hypothetical protein
MSLFLVSRQERRICPCWLRYRGAICGGEVHFPEPTRTAATTATLKAVDEGFANAKLYTADDPSLVRV